MSGTRNIIKSFRVETANSERKCHASSKHKIAPGDEHFAYDDPSRQNICKDCAPKILNLAETHLANVRRELGC